MMQARRIGVLVPGIVWRAVVAVSLPAIASPTPGQQPAVESFQAAARRLVVEEQIGLAGDLEGRSLEQLYESTSLGPLWSMHARPTRQALEVIDFLGRVNTKGLVPADYGADSLGAQARALAASQAPTVTEVVRFDLSISRSLVRVLGHLHRGRVDPHTLGFDLPDPHDGLDVTALATAVSAAADVPSTIASAEPRYVGYAALERILRRYRTLAADSQLLPPRMVTRPIRPGDRYDDMPGLRRMLAAVGDLSPDARTAADTIDGDLYAGPVVEAITRFQRRHGLAVDSIIGPLTMAALQIPMVERVRQIELTLERWRWLPDRPPPRYIVVNIPEFRLYAFENDSIAEHPEFTTKVIVGQSRGRHHTPLFASRIQEVTFRPYWDVPARIARSELVPRFRRQPDSLASEGYEIVGGDEDHATEHAPTAAALAGVAAGSLRLRQEPGPNNALGLVKFFFPNNYAVYLHGTPEQELFGRTRRDFSHGCIRVEDPIALSEFVLRDQSGWDRARIEAAMQGEHTLHVTIRQPVAIYILYGTVRGHADGRAEFYPDLYGYDAVLEKALGLPTPSGFTASAALSVLAVSR